LPKLPRVSGRRLIRALERSGCSRLRTVGDHAIMYSPKTDWTLSVPDTPKTLPVGTIASILRQAGLTGDELREFLR